MKNAAEPNPEPSNAFVHLLQHHRGGGALNELSEAIQKLIQAVKATDKIGALTFSIAIRPGSTGVSTVEVADKITLKIPEIASERSMFFTDETGRLFLNDPRQQELKLRTLPVVQSATEAQVIEIKSAANA